MRRLGLFGSFYGEKIPMIIMECLVLLAGVCLIIRSVYRYKKGKKREKKREEKEAKSGRGKGR